LVPGVNHAQVSCTCNINSKSVLHCGSH
jgi:hypothetical protein